MEIYPALRAFLLADAAIAALVDSRVFPVLVPQGKRYPVIRINEVTGIRYGKLRGKASLVRPHYQIDAIADAAGGESAYEACRTLSNLVRARLEGFDGVMVDDTVSPAVNWRAWVQFIDARDLPPEPNVNGALFGHSADYYVFHQVADS